MNREGRYYANVPRNKPLKEVLAENVTAIMDTLDLAQDDVAKAARRCGMKLSQSTVGRVKRAAFPASLDTIEALAIGLGVLPWQLLIDTLDPKALPKDALSAATLERDRARVEDLRQSISELSPQQRDMFIRENIVQDILAKPYYPPEKMGPGWDPPSKGAEPRKKQKP